MVLFQHESLLPHMRHRFLDGFALIRICLHQPLQGWRDCESVSSFCQVFLTGELLTPMQHARAEVASWPFLLNALSTGEPGVHFVKPPSEMPVCQPSSVFRPASELRSGDVSRAAGGAF